MRASREMLSREKRSRRRDASRDVETAKRAVCTTATERFAPAFPIDVSSFPSVAWSVAIFVVALFARVGVVRPPTPRRARVTSGVDGVRPTRASTPVPLARVMAATLRRRRGADAPSDDADDSDGKADVYDVRETTRVPRNRSGKTFWRAFALLSLARLASVSLNLVHDCDETYNFWEPLHYLTHGHGMQTWEHAPRFGLRSYAYLGAHALVARPAAWFVRHAVAADAADSDHVAQRVARLAPFYAVRLVFAAASALADATLVARIAAAHPLAGAVTLSALAWSAGVFVSSTAFLPSAFAGLCVTAAMGANLNGEHFKACAFCVAAVVFGWPFAGVAAIPFGLDSLRRRGFRKTLLYVTAPLVVALGVSVAADTYFYGKPTCSILNLLRYNVFPSASAGSARDGGANLYGVEPATFYFKNLALNFAHNAVLAFLAVPLGALAGSARYGRADGSRAAHFKLMTTHAPFPLALLLFSSLAHKEERFMYVAYSALCAGAGAAVGAFFDLCVAKSARSRAAAKRAGRKPTSGLVLLAAIGAGAACALTAAFGASRVAALAIGYGAPARAFALGLPTRSDDSTRHVCLGDDSWHRFPSSFFLPSDSYRIKFLDGAFDGALPVPFEKERGGTSFGAATLNDENRGEKEQRVADAARECDYVVEYAPPRVPEEEDESSSEYTSRPYLGKPPVTATVGENVGENVSSASPVGSSLEDEPSAEDELDPPRRAADRGAAVSWTLLWEAPFLDAGKSPALSRAFFVPGWSSKRNVFGTYRVYGKEAR